MAERSRYCVGCGSGGCAGCLPELDPPRYCGACGAWIATSVRPVTWQAECRRCAGDRFS